MVGFLGAEMSQGGAGVGGALWHLAGDEPHDPIGEPRGEVGSDFGEVAHLVLEVADHDFGAGVAGEGKVGGEDLVIDAAEGIHVGAGVEGAALELLWGHVEDGAHDGGLVVLGLERGGAGEFGEAEVEDFDLEFAAGEPDDHEVVRFEVAVDEAEVLGGDHALKGLGDDFLEVLDGEGAALDDLVESFALEVLHDDEGAEFVLADVVDGDDVRVLEGGEGAGFADEVLVEGLEAAGSGWFDALEGDVAVELGIGGEVDFAEAAVSDFSFDGVARNHGGEGARGGTSGRRREVPASRG